MDRLSKKLLRLRELEQVLLNAYPRGLHAAELARRIDIHRKHIPEYLADMAEMGVQVIEPADGLYAIDPATYRTQLRLSLDESLAVLLAVRLLTTRTDKQNPHAGRALEELANAIQKMAPFIARHIARAAAIIASGDRRIDLTFNQVVEALTRAWASGRQVDLVYESEEGRRLTHRFSPYFIEPYALGSTLHVIGASDLSPSLLTLKVERIREISETRESYSIPTDFDPTEILRSAWGIWRSDKQPQTVKLRFGPRVAYRLRETRWHPLERVEPEADGVGIVWTAPISEPREMLPWIRGWGADVEVLAPPMLRAALEDEVRRLGQVYGLSAQPAGPVSAPAFGILWAKADRFTAGVHRLIYHLIDVGTVTQILWERALVDALRVEIAAGLGLTIEEAGVFCSFVAALHDLGKASPTFQHHRSLSERMRRRFELERRAAGFSAVTSVHDPTPHQYVTTLALKFEGLLEPYGFDPSLVRPIAQALGGHHGTWPAAQLVMTFKSADRGDSTWQQVRRDLVAALVEVFAPPRQARLPEDLTQRNRVLTLISALVSAADWLGSDAESFPLREDWIPPVEYAVLSRELAESAVAQSDWRQPPAWTQVTAFSSLFGFEPRPTQTAALALANRLDRPFLAIVEAPMGLGKTEIALGLYAHWSARTGQTGLFVAMPTTATSNQMHGRVADWVGRWFGPDQVPLLVHSRSLLQVPPNTGEDPETNEGADLRRSWLLPKKRSLLASFGVGTVDQALLSVLQTKHFFVRLLGLSHKVVVFDEVHAYDTYMSTLFEHLLRWLRQLGVAVIVLSATLPAATRQRLIAAYSGQPERVRAAGYPSLSYTTGVDTETLTLTAGDQPPRRLRVDWIDNGPEAILRLLREALKDGGCAAVICNTVRSAQTVYEALADSEFAQLGEHLILFHARTLQVWRQQTENQVLSLFGPPHKSPARPHTAIVVATQVIEQSLDLDFDVMVSELAPIDLLLQRAGRLHRHDRPDRAYPYQLWIAGQRPGPGVPDLSRSDIHVYERAVLLASWAALGEQGAEIRLPDDLPALVARVYDPDAPLPNDPALRTALVTAREAMRVAGEQDAYAAKSRLVPGPDSEDLLLNTNLGLEEDDPAVNAAFQALTRADEPGLTVVCVFEGLNGFELDPEEFGAPINVFDPAPHEALALANNSLTVQRKDLIGLLRDQAASFPERWRRSALLRYSRLAVFRDGVCELTGERGTVRLALTRRLGLRTLNASES